MDTPTNQQSGADDIVIARIVKARGVRGEVACLVETDFPGRFASLEQVTVWMPDGTRLGLKIEDHWFHRDRVILKFEGYDTMSDARRLSGGRLVITETDLEPLGQDEFFEHQVIGSEVSTPNGQTLGHVSALMRTGGTDLLVVKDDEGRERLVPFAGDICTDVDVRAKRITVNPPEGLLDL